MVLGGGKIRSWLLMRNSQVRNNISVSCVIPAGQLQEQGGDRS